MHAGTHTRGRPGAGTIDVMVQLAIRCHPCAPASADELEGWLERQVDEDDAVGLALCRLTRDGPNSDLNLGWLVELELADGEPLLRGQLLADSLRDMRLLGLQPTLLAPPDGWANGRAA